MLADLIATEGVREVHRPGGPIGVMAIHGGLEEGTDQIASAVAAATGAALYAVVQPKTLWWHIPSIRYDPRDSAALASFLRRIDVAISLHGYGQPGLESTALLGGRNRRLARLVARQMKLRGIDAVAEIEAIPKRLRGVHGLNPVNRPRNAGVQVELPMNLRQGRQMRLVTEALTSSVARFARALPGSSPAG